MEETSTDSYCTRGLCDAKPRKPENERDLSGKVTLLHRKGTHATVFPRCANPASTFPFDSGLFNIILKLCSSFPSTSASNKRFHDPIRLKLIPPSPSLGPFNSQIIRLPSPSAFYPFNPWKRKLRLPALASFHTLNAWTTQLSSIASFHPLNSWTIWLPSSTPFRSFNPQLHG